MLHRGVTECHWAVLAAWLGWTDPVSEDSDCVLGVKRAQILCSGIVKAVGLNPTRSRDLKANWLNHEFSDSEYRSGGESMFQKILV